MVARLRRKAAVPTLGRIAGAIVVSKIENAGLKTQEICNVPGIDRHRLNLCIVDGIAETRVGEVSRRGGADFDCFVLWISPSA